MPNATCAPFIDHCSVCISSEGEDVRPGPAVTLAPHKCGMQRISHEYIENTRGPVNDKNKILKLWRKNCFGFRVENLEPKHPIPYYIQPIKSWGRAPLTYTKILMRMLTSRIQSSEHTRTTPIISVNGGGGAALMGCALPLPLKQSRPPGPTGKFTLPA